MIYATTNAEQTEAHVIVVYMQMLRLHVSRIL